MPRGDKGVACKSPGKQETDAEKRVIASLAEAIDRQTVSEVDTRLRTPIQHHRMENAVEVRDLLSMWR